MLTISTTDGKTSRFNLKNREREEALRNVWIEHDPISDGDKKLKVTTDSGDILTLRLRDISGVESNDSYHVRAQVNTGTYRAKR
jgi:hypothetical protein